MGPAKKRQAKATRGNTADKSDDEAPVAGPSGQNKTQRIAKACDKCRKSKSKCEPASTEGQPCKNCASTGAECTYAAPTFRRGPPKGYIQTLEHRLHQVESVLAAIMSSSDPRCQAIVEDLGGDDLASYILDAVDSGPFGRTGREQQAVDTTKDNFYASIVSEQPKTLSHRSRRQSRATRENVIESVIATDPQIQTTRPTLAWQDRLSARLVHGPNSDQAHTLSPAPAVSRSVSVESIASEPPRTRRRLHGPSGVTLPNRTPVSPSRPEQGGEDHLEDCAGAFGNLSIDENREVRYHGNSTGLQLLAQTERIDARNFKGIWVFPMAKLWPGPGANSRVQREFREDVREVERSVPLPPVEVQDHLIDVYFTYVNPAIPVLDEESFMLQYSAQKYGMHDTEEEAHTGQNDGEVQPERPQRISKLLLFSVFAYAASHLDPLEKAPGDVEDPANDYAKRARMILDKVYHESRSSTVQALILLGIREFGIASVEEGWLHIGMAIRMALDLGLNRNPDKWTHDGRDLFTEKERSIRKRIWWACCLADKFSALFLGRPIGIHEGEFSTPLLDVPEDDAERVWEPCSMDPLYGQINPAPANYIGYFRYLSSLYLIAGEVLAKVYRVSRANAIPSRRLREQLHQRLVQWALELPENLDYKPKSSKACPAPHIIAMHIQYWATVLLLHRPFIPQGTALQRAGVASLELDHVPWESYDICQSSASHIASFAMLYHEKYDMRWAPPFLANCLQAAGIMEVVTLRFQPSDTQASVGLQKCISALSGMERTWTAALRVRHLIQNAKVHVDQTLAISASSASSAAPEGRSKRPAHLAFADLLLPPPPTVASSSSAALAQPYNASTRYSPMQMETSQGYESQLRPDTYAGGYMPGYDPWWPVLEQQADGPLEDAAAERGHAQARGSGSDERASMPGVDDGDVAAPEPGPSTGSMGSQDFTFTPQQFSSEFLQAMRDPVLHFPSAFAHQY